jgi:low affinity Fe/Cu permease
MIRSSNRKNGSPKRNGGKRADLVAGAGTNNAGPISKLFGHMAQVTAHEVGRAWVFALALGAIIIWGVTGPLFGFSDTWQLVINTGTTIVTFLMVFLIQNTQNRDAAAIQIKLDELIRVGKAHNSFVGLEHLTDEELEEIRAKCEQRAKTDNAELSAQEQSRRPQGKIKAPGGNPTRSTMARTATRD